MNTTLREKILPTIKLVFIKVVTLLLFLGGSCICFLSILVMTEPLNIGGGPMKLNLAPFPELITFSIGFGLIFLGRKISNENPGIVLVILSLVLLVTSTRSYWRFPPFAESLDSSGSFAEDAWTYLTAFACAGWTLYLGVTNLLYRFVNNTNQSKAKRYIRSFSVFLTSTLVFVGYGFLLPDFIRIVERDHLEPPNEQLIYKLSFIIPSISIFVSICCIFFRSYKFALILFISGSIFLFLILFTKYLHSS